MAKVKAKTLSQSYLYGIGKYEKNLYKFFMSAKEVDKSSESFKDIAYNMKRAQSTAVLSKVLESKNVILLRHDTPLPSALKVFTAADARSGDKKVKVFIDVSEVISDEEGHYSLPNKKIDIFVAYLFSALAHLIYAADPDRIRNNTSLLENGTEAFASLFYYIIDSMRLAGVDKVKEKCLYLGSVYYQTNLLQKEITDSVETRAIKISKLSTRESDVLNLSIGKDSYKDIKNFIDTVAEILKIDTLKIDNFIEKWLFLLGAGTQFATELYPAFSSLITNAYVGAYLNNQKAIEKVIGAKTLTGYTNALIRLGSELQ